MTMPAASNPEWALRTIPLPQQMTFTAALPITAGDVVLVAPQRRDPLVRQAASLLRALARGPRGAPVQVRLTLGDLRSRLPAGLRTLDQAYAITATATAGGGAAVRLQAMTPYGLLCAARTWWQLLAPQAVRQADPNGSQAVPPTTPLLVPLGEVLDWPAIPERGQWGGNCESDLPWLAARKLNVIEANARAGHQDGQPTIGLDPALLDEGTRLGVHVVPFLPHLEQLAGLSGLRGWEDCYSVPTPERAKRNDYVPGLCMSADRTPTLVARWLREVAVRPGVTDVQVWLSEEACPCQCERCRGREQFALELETIVRAFRLVQAEVNPSLRLRVLLTQATWPVNDQVIAAAPPDVGITYYDGGRTYDSSHAPMIYPLLEAHARSGRWLGVYPQVTHAWRTVLPFTGAQFIHTRLNEFAGKGLANVIGYAVPGNRYHEFNVTALAEWAWNPTGRGPREFARAWAWQEGLADVEAFADWAERLGPVGWDLAASRLFLSLIYSPTMGLGEGVPFDHRFAIRGEDLGPAQLTADLARAREARDCARRLNWLPAVAETEFTIGAVRLLLLLRQLLDLPAEGAALTAEQRQQLPGWLDELDLCAAAISTRLGTWGDWVGTRTGAPRPSRLVDTIQAAPRLAHHARRILGARAAVPDPRPAYRYREVGGWTTADFAAGPVQTLRFDVTAFLDGPGPYVACLDFVDSAWGLTPRTVTLVSEADGGRRECRGTDQMTRCCMWDRSGECTVDLADERPGARYVLEIEAEGTPTDAPADRRTCEGRVSLRRGWRSADVPEHFFTGG